MGVAAQGENAEGRAGGVGAAEVDHDAAVAFVAAVLGDVDGVVHVAPGPVVLVVGFLDLQLDPVGLGQGDAGGADCGQEQGGAEALQIDGRGSWLAS